MDIKQKIEKLGDFNVTENLKDILGDLSTTKRLGQILGGLDETDTLKAIIGAFDATQNLKAILGDLSTTKRLGQILGGLDETNTLKAILGAYTAAAPLKTNVDTIVADTPYIHDQAVSTPTAGSLAQVLAEDIYGRTNNKNLNALLGVPDGAGKSLGGNIGDFQAQTNLTTLLAALAIPDTAGKGLFVELATDRLDKQHSGTHKNYPLLADPKTLASGGVAWTYGGYVEIVPVNTITSDFWITGIEISNPSAADNYVVCIATGLAASEVDIIEVPATRTDVTAAGVITSVIIPVNPPVKVTANTRISGRSASKAAAANSVDVKILYAIGLR